MDFTNHTPFPALAFAGIDPHGHTFHVLVLRQTLTFATGALEYADEQAPLREEDEFFGEPHVSSVRQESDLCHYKPKCDVLVNATAYAPGGHALPRFTVGLKITGATRRTVLEKHLTVTGPRDWEKTLFSWKLRAPEPITTLPLRDEFAYGGTCRIAAEDPAAARVKPEFRLTPAQQAQHPDPANLPLSHTVYEENPRGLGYTEAWHRDALKLTRIAAPQIEDPNDPVVAFDKHYAPQGLGVRPKSHPARRKLGGTIDAAFIENNKPLPDDFDFAVWNAAPPDQQCDFLHGGEVIELTNLCAPGTPGAKCDVAGNTVLTLTLPAHVCFSLVRLDSGEMFIHPLVLDTLIVEPDARTLTLVWRTVLAHDPELPIRALEARMHSAAEHSKLQAQIERIEKVLTRPDAEVRHVQ